MKRIIKLWIENNIFYLLTFVIPFCAALIAFIAQGVWPLGERGISIIDSYHQYVPFFSELQYKWKNFDSLLYSWNGALGMNFLVVIAYYLASPLNFLLLIFPKSLVMECFTLIYLIKLGLSGVSFAYYIRRRFNRYDFTVTVFGCMYALSSFIVGYGWNIMWLDCIVFFPMVMLGIYYLVYQGKGSLYGVSLALCILTNYYIAFMICIFSCIFLLVEMSCYWEIRIKECLTRGFLFAIYSLLAGGTAAVLLIPTMHALEASASGTSSFPTTLKFYHSVYELLCQQFSFVEPTNLTGNLNFYAGSILLILIPVFLVNKKIHPWHRLVKMFVTVFLIVCLNTNYLTYIWHGFHFPNGLPGRYSFIYIFMLLIMGYEGCQKYRGCPKWIPSAAAGCWLAFLAYCCYSGKAEVEIYTIIVNIVLLSAYGVLMTLVFMRVKRWKMFRDAMFILIGIEAFSYGIFGLCMNGTVNRKDYYSDQGAVLAFKEQIETTEIDNFYRVELEERRGRDDVTWHNLPGASMFSSTVNAGVNQLLKRVGYFAATNKYSYEGATPETDAFFDIKYLISKDLEEQIRTFEYVSTEDIRHLYINEDALGLGFMVSEDILSWDYEKTNPFEVINQMMTSAMGEEVRPYSYFGLPQPMVDGAVLTTDSWADWSYTASDKKDGTITYTYVSDQMQDMYIYFKASHCSNIAVDHNGSTKTYSDEDGHIIHVGQVYDGDTVTLTLKMDPAYDSGYIKLIAARHDSALFEQSIEALKQTSWVIDEKESTYLKGSIQVLEDGIMFTSIPYDEGWTITVDGCDVKAEKIAGAFIGLRLSEGEHIIEMNYVPKGYARGLRISVVCVMLLLLLVLMQEDVLRRIRFLKNAIIH